MTVPCKNNDFSGHSHQHANCQIPNLRVEKIIVNTTTLNEIELLHRDTEDNVSE